MRRCFRRLKRRELTWNEQGGSQSRWDPKWGGGTDHEEDSSVTPHFPDFFFFYFLACTLPLVIVFTVFIDK